MGYKVICLVKRAGEIIFTQPRRFRTRWLSRSPVKVSYDGETEMLDKVEEKLNIERQVLKRGKQIYSQKLRIDSIENDARRNKLSQLATVHLQECGLDENSLMSKECESRQSVQKKRKLCRPDPFALSSLMPEDENTNEFLEVDVPPFPAKDRQENFNCPSGDDRTVHKSNKTSLKALNLTERSTISKMKSVSVDEISTKNKMKSATEDVCATEGSKKLRKVMLMTKSKKMRDKHNLVVIEGKRLISDFIGAGAIPKMVFFSRLQDMDGICVPANCSEVYKVTYKQLSLWTDVETSQGLIGVFEMSQVSKQTPMEDALPITAICDNIRNPGNVGSVLRIAAAAGCEKVILTKGCVDLWDSKVLRSAAGAHSCMPVVKDVPWEDVHEHLPDGCVTFAADSSPSHTDMTPLVHYNKANFGSAPHVALVVGGETHGLSSSALALASARLHVPLSHGVDSLNSAIAFAVIVFEARRHLMAGS